MQMQGMGAEPSLKGQLLTPQAALFAPGRLGYLYHHPFILQLTICGLEKISINHDLLQVTKLTALIEQRAIKDKTPWVFNLESSIMLNIFLVCT